MDLIGNTYLVDFGMAKATLHFINDTEINFIIVEKDGSPTDTTEKVTIGLTELRPKLYLIIWTEKSGTTVSQVQDHENGVIYSNWTVAGQPFHNVKGTIKPV